MYFEMENWHETKVGEKETCIGGKLHVMSQAPITVWALGIQTHVEVVQDEDGETVRTEHQKEVKRLVGTGREVKANFGNKMVDFICEGKSPFVQFFDVISPQYIEEGEVFLNGDRVPDDGDVFEGSMRLRRLAEQKERRELASERIKEKFREREAKRLLEEEQESARLEDDAKAQRAAAQAIIDEGTEE